MFFRFFSFVGLIICIIVVIAFASVFGLLAFSHVDLPNRIDEPPARYEGLVRKDINLTLLTRKDSDRDGLRRVAVLQNDITYFSKAFRKGADEDIVFIVPISRYFVSDFASIPAPADRLINPFGRHAEAAIVHDWLYAFGESGRRRDADVVFYRAMVVLEVPWLRRRIMYAAVRLFGGGKSYGTRSEWDGNFYSPLVRAPLPAWCILDREDELFDSFLREEDESTIIDFVNGDNELGAELLDSFYQPDWQHVFAKKQCQEYLALAAMRSREAFNAFAGQEIFSDSVGQSPEEIADLYNDERPVTLGLAAKSVVAAYLINSVTMQALTQVWCDTLREESQTRADEGCRGNPMRIDLNIERLPELQSESDG